MMQSLNGASPDPFGKCRLPSAVEDASTSGSFPWYREIAERAGGNHVVMDGRRRLMAGSNDYLALSMDPRLRAAGADALRRWGSGNSGSRVLNGTLALHRHLEDELAEFLGHEAAMVVATGYQANLTLSPLFGERDVLLADRQVHASLVEAARLGCSPVRRYRHDDADHLDRLLKEADPDSGRLVLTEGMFSVTGRVSRLPGIVAAVRRHGARLILDSAHDVGLLGDGGRGAAEHHGLQQAVDLQTLTFSKCLGTVGGAVAGPRHVIDHLRAQSRAALYSASLPAACTAAARAALRIVRTEPERRSRVRAAARRLRAGLASIGHPVTAEETPTVPLYFRDPALCCRFWQELFDEGVVANAMLPPSVPGGRSLIRLSLTADHTDADVDRILEAVATATRRLDPPLTAAPPSLPGSSQDPDGRDSEIV